MRTIRDLAMASAVAMLLPVAAAPAQDGTMSSDSFAALDLDRSRHVDAVEFGVAMGYAFADADQDGDGRLTATEAAALSLPAQVDADGSGTVELTEFLLIVRKDFLAADKDGNNALHP
jgi:hypothetical protein